MFPKMFAAKIVQKKKFRETTKCDFIIELRVAEVS